MADKRTDAQTHQIPKVVVPDPDCGCPDSSNKNMPTVPQTEHNPEHPRRDRRQRSMAEPSDLGSDPDVVLVAVATTAVTGPRRAWQRRTVAADRLTRDATRLARDREK